MISKKRVTFENTMFELSMRLTFSYYDFQIDYFESSVDYQIVKNDVKQVIQNIEILPSSKVSSVHIIHGGKIHKYVNIGNLVYSSKNNLLKYSNGTLESFKDSIIQFVNSYTQR